MLFGEIALKNQRFFFNTESDVDTASVVIDEKTTMMLGMQFRQASGSGREDVLKQSRRCWLSNQETKVATAEEH